MNRDQFKSRKRGLMPPVNCNPKDSHFEIKCRSLGFFYCIHACRLREVKYLDCIKREGTDWLNEGAFLHVISFDLPQNLGFSAFLHLIPPNPYYYPDFGALLPLKRMGDILFIFHEVVST